MITVPDSKDMAAEIFRKHLEHRHIPCGDFANLKSFYAGWHFVTNRAVNEAYHRYLHERYEYDHAHTE